MRVIGRVVGDFVRDDQLMFLVDRRLHVVADFGRAVMHDHRARVRVSQRHLPRTTFLQALFERLILRFPLRQSLDLLTQFRGARPRLIGVRLGGIGLIQAAEIAGDLFLQRRDGFG